MGSLRTILRVINTCFTLISCWGSPTVAISIAIGIGILIAGREKEIVEELIPLFDFFISLIKLHLLMNEFGVHGLHLLLLQ